MGKKITSPKPTGRPAPGNKVPKTFPHEPSVSDPYPTFKDPGHKGKGIKWPK